MPEQEFVAPVAPSLGEAPDVAPQQGASVMPSQVEGVQQAQIATPPPPPAPTAPAQGDWTQDPKFREFQSKFDKLEAQNRKLQNSLEQAQRDNQVRLRQMEEADFQRQYQNEWTAAPPERKGQVEQKYRELKNQRDMAAQGQEMESLRAAQAVSGLQLKAMQAGVPADVIAQTLAEAGHDPRAQANAMIELPYNWMQFQQSKQQPQQPQYAPQQPYGYGQPVYQQPMQPQYQQPVQAQPVQAPPPPVAPQEPLRQPAAPVARPGTVTPSEQRAWSLRNQAMDSGDWSTYNEYKKRMVREARNAAAGR